jgi:hypothetical protein
MPSADLRAARANRIFRADEKRIRTENAVFANTVSGMGPIRDRRWHADVFLSAYHR